MKLFKFALMADVYAERKGRGRKKGKEEDDAVAFDFERTAEMQRVSAARFRSDGGDITKR